MGQVPSVVLCTLQHESGHSEVNCKVDELSEGG
jgi:hypothetical protein